MTIDYFKNIISNFTSLKKSNTSFFGFLVALIIAVPQIGSAQCTYSLELTDSWGDGWNGGQLEVTTGTTIDTVTLTNPPGNFQVYPLLVNTNDAIVLNYLGGSSYNSEVSFELKDVSGTVLYSSGTGPATGIAYSTTANCPSCLPPTALGVNGLTSTSAFAIWQAGGTEAAWDLEYGTTGFTQGAGTLVSPTSTQYFLQNLTPNTGYEFYVRADCNGTPSPWAGPFSFFTGYCTPSSTSTLTYIDGFSTTGGSVNISNLTTGYTTGGYLDATASHSVESYAGGNFSFSSTIVGGTVGFSIWVDWNNDLVFDNATEKVFNTTSYSNGPFSGTVNIPIGASLGNYTMRITTDYNSSNPALPCGARTRAEFEDYRIVVAAPPSCVPPTTLTATASNATTASLGWTSLGNETAWDVEFGSTGFTLGTGTRVTSQTNPYVVSTLTAQTNYQFYVRANCGTDTSSWVGPFAFSTPCATINTFPYMQNFDAATAVPTCWSQSAFNVENWLFNTGTSASHGGQGSDHTTGSGNFAWIDDSSPYNANPAGLETPPFDMSSLTSPRIRFWFTNRGTSSSLTVDPSKFYLEAFNGSTWVIVDSIVGQNIINWTEFTYDLTAYKSSNTMLRFLVFENQSSFNSDVSIDDIVIEETPSCPNPTLVMVDTVTSNSATFSWTNGGSETNWNIEYGPAGFTQGTGTVVAVTSNPTTITGLMANTAYSVFLQADCGNNDLSPWTNGGVFTTACASYTASHYEGFDGTTDPNIDQCWTVIEDLYTSTGTPTTGGWIFTENSTSDPRRSGVNSIEIYNGSGVSGLLALVSPVFSDLDNTKRVRFYIQDKGSTSYTSDVIVGIMSNPSDTSTFTPIDTIFKSQLSANWLEVVVNLRSGLGNHVAIAHGLNSTFDYLWLDDFNYENIPSCFKPSNFTNTNVGTTTADFTWTADQYPNTWAVEYGLAGYTPGTGTSVIVTDTMANITGLTDATMYDFYVREICGAGDSSIWEGPLQITTNCLAVTSYPFFENFDAIAATPLCWSQSAGNVENWLINTGSSATYGGQGSDHTTGSGNFAWIDDSSPHNANPSGLESPVLDLTAVNTPSLKFWFTNRGTSLIGNTSKFYVDIYDGTNWTNGVDSVVGVNVQAWTELSVNLTPYKSSTSKIRFTVFEEPSNFYSDVSIDDILVDNFPVKSMANASSSIACSGDTIMLIGMAEDGSGNYSYSWSPSTNLIGASNDTAWFVANSSETFILTVNDGFTNSSDTVSVTVNQTPTLNITSSSDPWCNEVNYQVSTNAGMPMIYWSNGDFGAFTSTSLSEGIGNSISVMVSDTTGCVAMGQADFYADEHIQSYTLFATDFIRLPNRNKVVEGGVGVQNLGGYLRVDNFSGPEGTNGFIIGDVLNIASSANYSFIADTNAGAVMLPMHNASGVSSSGTTTIYAQRGTTKVDSRRNVNVIAQPSSNITLTAHRYGDVLVKRGATVTFTHPNVQLNSLTVENSGLVSMGAAVRFTQDGSMRVSGDVYIGARSVFNPDSLNVNVFVGGNATNRNFTFKAAATEINANVFVDGGKIKANRGFAPQWTKVSGRMIADTIISNSPKIRWIWSDCGSNFGPVMPPVALKKDEANALEETTEEVTKVEADGLVLTLAPNPTTNNFMVQLSSLSTLGNNIQITITSQDGRMIETRSLNSLNNGLSQEFSLAGYSNGIYFVSITVGDNVFREKLVLTR